jgi:hypothetical protein
MALALGCVNCLSASSALRLRWSWYKEMALMSTMAPSMKKASLSSPRMK